MPPTIPISIQLDPPHQRLEYWPPTSILLVRTVVDQQTTGADTQPDNIIGGYLPYSPPSSLHAATLPAPTAPEPNGPGPAPPSHKSHPIGLVIAITFSAVFASLLCILGFTMILARAKRKGLKSVIEDFLRRSTWVHRPPKITKPVSTVPEVPVVYISAKTASPGMRIQDTLDLHLESEISEGSEDGNTKSVETEISEGPTPPPYIPPSVISQECIMIGDGHSAPTMAGFLQRLEAEETDITLAIGIAMRDHSYSGTEINFIHQNAEQLFADHHRNSWDVQNRARQGSDASESTQPMAEWDVFSITATTCSSRTSIRGTGNDSDLEDMELDEDIDTEEIVFEVGRAQAQSMEIKRGILVDWGAQKSPVMEEVSRRLQKSSPHSPFPTVPSLVVTCPSMMTIPIIGPSFSSISVDLNEFPLPPEDVDCMLFDKLDMCLPACN